MASLASFLWLESKAEEAARFYVSLFTDGEIDRVMRVASPPDSDDPDRVLSVEFRMNGQSFVAFNGGPHYSLTPAFSLFVGCEDQAEIDRLWDALADGGAPLQCGWITDRFGVSWQVAPKALGAMMADPDPAKNKRLMEALFKMVKLDLATLEAAYRGD